MSTAVMSLRLPVEIKERLDLLSASTGRPAAYYVRADLDQHLGDLESAYQLRSKAEAVRLGQLPTRPIEDLMTELGVTQAEIRALQSHVRSTGRVVAPTCR